MPNIAQQERPEMTQSPRWQCSQDIFCSFKTEIHFGQKPKPWWLNKSKPNRASHPNVSYGISQRRPEDHLLVQIGLEQLMSVEMMLSGLPQIF